MKFNVSINLIIISISQNIDLTSVVTLKVHFKDISCIKYRRDVYLTWDGLFGNKGLSILKSLIKLLIYLSASFGGIFGLCLGGSVLSFVEFLYFFTFRLWNNLRTGRKSARISSFRLGELGRRRNSRMMQLLRTGGLKLAAGTNTIRTRKMTVTEVKPVVEVSLVSADGDGHSKLFSRDNWEK